MIFTPSSSVTISLIHHPSLQIDLRFLRTKESFKKKKTDDDSINKPSHYKSARPLSLELLPLTTHHCNVAKVSLSSSAHPDSDSCGEVDLSLLASKLRSCCTEEDVRRMHTIVVKHSEYLNTYLGNNLISAYAKNGNMVEARKVFDRMPQRNVVSWTAILNAYINSASYKEALSIFKDFTVSGNQANFKTFVCALNLCSKRLDYSLGKQVHANIIKSGGNNLVVDTTIVYFYAQCRDLSSAYCAFVRMHAHDVISWTTMITAYSQHGLGKKAFSLFTRMLLEGYVANEFTLCSVLNVCGEEESLALGRQLHGAIVKKIVKNDVFIGTSLVDMYAKCGQIVDSRKVFDEMKNRNTVTWTAIITGYARNGFGEEAINLFRLMRRRNLFVNNLTMVSIIKACGLTRGLILGKEVHAQLVKMKNSGENEVYTGSSLVWMYCKCEESGIAWNVLQQMPFKDVVSWTTMISGCNHLGHEFEALELLKEMLGKGVEPNPFTYSSALKACARLENIEEGRLIHRLVNETEARANVFVGSALIFMYMKCGFISEAVQVFDCMPERNLVAWKAMIVGYAKNGLCHEALKLLYRMKAEGFEVDDYVHTTVLTSCGEDINGCNLEVLLELEPHPCLQN